MCFLSRTLSDREILDMPAYNLSNAASPYSPYHPAEWRDSMFSAEAMVGFIGFWQRVKASRTPILGEPTKYRISDADIKAQWALAGYHGGYVGHVNPPASNLRNCAKCIHPASLYPKLHRKMTNGRFRVFWGNQGGDFIGE